MPRYHFHAADGTRYRDEDGEELPNLKAAKDAALRVMVQMLPAKSEEFWDSKTFSVYVKDEAGRLVVALTTTALVDSVPESDEPPEA